MGNIGKDFCVLVSEGRLLITTEKLSAVISTPCEGSTYLLNGGGKRQGFATLHKKGTEWILIYEGGFICEDQVLK